jgi:hypothetical protein
MSQPWCLSGERVDGIDYSLARRGMLGNDQYRKTERNLAWVVHDEVSDLCGCRTVRNRSKDCHDRSVDSIVLIGQGVRVKIEES